MRTEKEKTWKDVPEQRGLRGERPTHFGVLPKAVPWSPGLSRELITQTAFGPRATGRRGALLENRVPFQTFPAGQREQGS